MKRSLVTATAIFLVVFLSFSFNIAIALSNAFDQMNSKNPSFGLENEHNINARKLHAHFAGAQWAAQKANKQSQPRTHTGSSSRDNKKQPTKEERIALRNKIHQEWLQQQTKNKDSNPQS